MMNKLFCLVAVVCVLSAFVAPENDSFPERLVQRLVQLVQRQPQEKVYLHTDRDHYDAGERVWFRAYLTNSVNHRRSEFSRYVYVELRDRQDSLYARVKLALRDSIFAGYMPLPKRLPQGDYFLRSYTYWMQNAGDEYIFRKKIRVINPEDSKVQTEVTYEDTDKGQVAKIRFFNSRKEPYGKVFVDYTRNNKLKRDRTDDDGYMYVKVDSTDFGKRLKVQFQDGGPIEYRGTVFLPDLRKDFELTFMPEGGDLLVGCQQTVAFKAIGCDGLSRKVTGVVVNKEGEQVAFLQSLHKGMGAFELVVEPGQEYTAVVKYEDMEKQFALPKPTVHGMALKVVSNAEILGYALLGADSVPLKEDLFFVAHSRGVPLVCQPIEVGDKGKLPLVKLPEGILHLLVMDSKGEVYTQRLCFVRKGNRPELLLQTDQEAYGVREPVYVDVQVVADSSQVLKGSFSVAVTADGKCERDSLAGNILSDLLLTSDLKGYIEDPALYFKDNRVITRRFLDLLMMTQGWTRFDVQKILKQEYDSLRYYMERGQAISGKVKNFWGKDAGNANLILLGTNGLFQLVNADTSGFFMIDGIAFPDSTKFVLQGRNKKGRRNVEVVVDQDEYLSPSVKWPFGGELMSREEDFFKKFARDYYYDNGIKVYVLDEAVVKRKVPKKSSSFYDGMADYNLDSAKLASMENMDMRMVLQEIPGIEAWGDSVTRFGKSIYLMVNDFEEEFSYILNMTPRDLVSISFIRSPMSGTLFGEKAANGAIIITTNPNFVPRDAPKLNMVTFSMLGYQRKAEFYMPHYEVDSVRMALKDSVDYRTTIYWNPAVRTDESGKAKFFFTTSDGYGPYTMIIEGILNDGTVCRKEKKIKLRSW